MHPAGRPGRRTVLTGGLEGDGRGPGAAPGRARGRVRAPGERGQAIGPVVTGSVEYGPMTGGTPLIMVLGHRRCGAIEASYEALKDGAPLPGNLQAIVKAVEPAYRLTVENPGADFPSTPWSTTRSGSPWTSCAPTPTWRPS
ncbi:carbonic anhydrase [Streptomyces sp. 147326]|uniref:carbonic anhydrase n=1 Tax=Streptomyces sp. 147326 TaxID=3074379 RepID=UPI0038572FA0